MDCYKLGRYVLSLRWTSDLPEVRCIDKRIPCLQRQKYICTFSGKKAVFTRYESVSFHLSPERRKSIRIIPRLLKNGWIYKPGRAWHVTWLAVITYIIIKNLIGPESISLTFKSKCVYAYFECFFFGVAQRCIRVDTWAGSRNKKLFPFVLGGRWAPKLHWKKDKCLVHLPKYP